MNSLTLIGNAGKDAELTYTPTGLAVAKFSIADNHKGKDSDKPETTWYDCVAWGKTAETLTPLVKRGTKLYVMGTLRLRTWTGKDDKPRTTPEITIDKFFLLEPKQPASAPTPASETDESFPF
jgi:single-strand DNA-binding protein